MSGRAARAILTALAAAATTVAAADGARADVDGGAAAVGGCVELVPQGGRRPIIEDTFPARGTSGYASTLVVKIEHGKGETVLPRGLELQTASEAAKALREAGFAIPDQDGGSAARLVPSPGDANRPDRATTTLELPLLVLPPSPGRQTLTLPPLPVSVARASGEVASVCTRPHKILVEDPTADTPEAKPRPNPPPRAQREEWVALERALGLVAVGLVLGALAAWAWRRWRRRPKPVPPPPPPRPPWEIALERIDEVRHAGLLEVARYDEYFDRLNDAVRSYLGARYGFDGLESTTDEILGALEHAQLGGLSFADVVTFLRECDLVKFARMTPSVTECTHALDSGERIVRATMPLAGSGSAVGAGVGVAGAGAGAGAGGPAVGAASPYAPRVPEVPPSSPLAPGELLRAPPAPPPSQPASSRPGAPSSSLAWSPSSSAEPPSFRPPTSLGAAEPPPPPAAPVPSASSAPAAPSAPASSPASSPAPGSSPPDPSRPPPSSKGGGS